MRARLPTPSPGAFKDRLAGALAAGGTGCHQGHKQVPQHGLSCRPHSVFPQLPHDPPAAQEACLWGQNSPSPPPPKCVHTRLGPPALERALDAGGASRLWSHTRRLYSLGNVGAYTRVVTLPSAYEHTRTLTHTLEGLSVLSLSRSAKAKAVSHPAARPPGQMALMRSAPSRHLPPSPAVRRRLCTSPAGWFGVGR